MYTPSQTLDTEIWYWQVGEVPGRGKQVWSERYSFEVTARSRKIVRPHADQLLSLTPVDRPRLVPARKDVSRLQANVSHPLAQRLYEQTAHLIGRPLPNDRTPPDQGDDAYKRMKFARWGSKALAGKEVDAIEGLLCAWLLNGNDRFVAEAVRRAVNVASWDSDGFTNPVISDFADASSVRAMALVYDAAHGQLIGQERRQIRDALVARCSRCFDDSFNGFGDGTDLHHQPNGRHLHLMDYLGSRFADPAAKTYADEWRQRLEKPVDVGPRLALIDLINKVPPSKVRKCVHARKHDSFATQVLSLRTRIWTTYRKT